MDDILNGSFLPAGLENLEDFELLQKSRSVPCDGSNIVLFAVPPKSGSRFIIKVVKELFGLYYESEDTLLSFSNCFQSRDIYLPTAMRCLSDDNYTRKKFLCHNHLHASPANLSIIRNLNLKLVLGSRNILDTLISYKEYNDLTKTNTPEFLTFTSENYRDLSDEQTRWAYVNIGPAWYARYYGSWLKHTQTETVKANPVFQYKYADLVNDPVGLFERLMQYLDAEKEYTRAQIEVALKNADKKKKEVGFNKGVTGRGAKYFTDHEKDTIYKMMSPYSSRYTRLLEDMEVL